METSPSWIIRCGLALSALRLFYPNEPTFIVRFGMSQTCQRQTSGADQAAPEWTVLWDSWEYSHVCTKNPIRVLMT
jgi:hypothetical protein